MEPIRSQFHQRAEALWGFLAVAVILLGVAGIAAGLFKLGAHIALAHLAQGG